MFLGDVFLFGVWESFFAVLVSLSIGDPTLVQAFDLFGSLVQFSWSPKPDHVHFLKAVAIPLRGGGNERKRSCGLPDSDIHSKLVSISFRRVEASAVKRQGHPPMLHLPSALALEGGWAEAVGHSVRCGSSWSKHLTPKSDGLQPNSPRVRPLVLTCFSKSPTREECKDIE